MRFFIKFKILCHSVNLFLPLVAFLLTGCAYVVSGRTQVLYVESEPRGADVIVDGIFVGQTPVSVDVKRSEETKIIVQKDGYLPETLIPRTKLNGMIWGNILVAPFLGSTTDSATGASIEYSPDQYYALLVKNEEDRVASDSRRILIIRYILVNYYELGVEMNKGEGEFLNSLCQLLEIPKIKKSAALSKIGELYSQNRAPSQFAEAVVSSFLKEN